MLSKKFIIAGSILSIGLIFLNAHFVFGSVVPMSLFVVGFSSTEIAPTMMKPDPAWSAVEALPKLLTLGTASDLVQ
ncbi:MAG: hypothetical protein HYU31_06150 [Deltaproteobacteria bacterium]|nr:hypothetical protein [Deltaproteobacteria bacterium]